MSSCLHALPLHGPSRGNRVRRRLIRAGYRLAGRGREIRGGLVWLGGRLSSDKMLQVLGLRERLVGTLQRHRAVSARSIVAEVDAWLLREVRALLAVRTAERRLASARRFRISHA